MAEYNPFKIGAAGSSPAGPTTTMKITFEFPDYQETNVYGAIEWRKQKVQEAIEFLMQHQNSLGNTIVASQHIGKEHFVLVVRDQDVW